MDKETLFQEIRQGEVLLWVGAGFSHYAGYPLGRRTVELLHESLSSEQQQLDPMLPLPRYAEELVDLHNGRRYHLTRQLQRLFMAEPTSTTYHELLAQIPFLDKIVTTNYDTLFERVYGSRLHKITKGRDLPLGEPGQVEFYKVHGDIHDAESLIVTEQDYRAFFKKRDELLWKQLETLMAKYTVLFLGYSLEDQNVLALFEELLDKLGPLHRGAYLVAPGLQPSVANRLRRRQVTYLDMTGEVLVEEALASIKNNVLQEVKKGVASTDKTSQFLRGLGLNFTSETTSQHTGPVITSISRLDGPTRYAVSVSVRPGAPAAAHLRKLTTGKTSAPAHVPLADLQDFQFTVEGVRMPLDDMASLIVARAPGFNKVVDVFFQDGTRFHNVEMRAYGRDQGLQVVAYTTHALVKVNITTTDEPESAEDGLSGTVAVTPRGGVYSSVQAGQEVCDLMRTIGKGGGCRIFEEGNLLWTIPPHPLNGFTQSADQLQQLLDDLQVVENAFGIVLKQFELSDRAAPDLYRLAQTLRRTSVLQPATRAMLLTWSEPLTEELKEVAATDAGNFNLILDEAAVEEFALLGWRFQVTLRRRHIFERALLKLAQAPLTYRLSSKTDNVVMLIQEITSHKILQRGQPQPFKTPAEQLLEELTTDEMS